MRISLFLKEKNIKTLKIKKIDYIRVIDCMFNKITYK